VASFRQCEYCVFEKLLLVYMKLPTVVMCLRLPLSFGKLSFFFLLWRWWLPKKEVHPVSVVEMC
jgi:hypothetical protein